MASERPEAAADERMESEQIGSDGDDDGQSSAAESEASTAEFKQPRAHLRRRKRVNKRNVERRSTGSDTNGLSKTAKVPESASDSDRGAVHRQGRACAINNNRRAGPDDRTSKQPDENSDESTTAESRDRLRTVVSSSNGTASIGCKHFQRQKDITFRLVN